MGCFDHQISGRFGELEKIFLIIKCGSARRKPATGCEAEVYTIIKTVGLGMIEGRLNTVRNTACVGAGVIIIFRRE